MAKVKQTRLSSDIQPSLRGRESTRSKPAQSGKVQQGKLVKVNPPCDKDGLLFVTQKKRVIWGGKAYWVPQGMIGE